MQVDQYPVAFAVDYPDRELDRLTTAFRLVVAIPILIVLGSVGGETMRSNEGGRAAAATAGGVLFLGPLLMILFRQKARAGGSTGICSSRGSATGLARISP